MVHIGVTSLLFGARPEGVCTERLVRALVENGYRVTLYTSKKAKSAYRHRNLSVHVYPFKPHRPRWFFKLWAKFNGDPVNNFYLWGKRIQKCKKIESDIPDFFYGRAWPHASLVPAYFLSQKFSKPLVLHFSDPFPPPDEGLPKQSFLDDLQKMVSAADAISFTNHQTVKYQQRFLQFPEEKAHIITHVSPKPKWLPEPPNNQHFYLIGSVGNNRPANVLLEGFAQYLKTNPSARLFFVGSPKKYVEPLIAQYQLSESVKLLPFSSDVTKTIEQASALIMIDCFVEHPTWTQTKLGEYCHLNRKVLALTPPGSPADEIFTQNASSAVVVRENNAAAMAKGFEQVFNLSPSREDYENRFENTRMFNEESVVEAFEGMCGGIRVSSDC